MTSCQFLSTISPSKIKMTLNRLNMLLSGAITLYSEPLMKWEKTSSWKELNSLELYPFHLSRFYNLQLFLAISATTFILQ